MDKKCLFDKQKAQALQTIDLSRKGSFDNLIHDLLANLNRHVDYFTLSSCSGRIVLLKSEKVIHRNFATLLQPGNKFGTSSKYKININKASFQNVQNTNKKKGCNWLICSHDRIEFDAIWNILKESESSNSRSVDDFEEITTTLKFEPFILHVQCRNLDAAKLLHTSR